MEFIFATGNANKLKEVRELLGDDFIIKGLKDIGFDQEIPEPHATLEENALEKVRTIANKYGKNCFAEDTGLEVQALNMEPGVRSARYSGENKSSEANIQKVLANLGSETKRAAQFRTVLALVIDEKEHLFEGVCEGEILKEIRNGGEGFGYDPIFQPTGYERSFAEMSADEKNKISHRGQAIRKMCEFLVENLKTSCV